ncbi:MAG TPA: PQQ-dependent sugar dehydrogenase, partial [Ardenticatenaceae bacterium]|nr:PQQ-dependent sugar dehydrogenase [Ardenticatenaceae bacterium]
EGLRRPVQVTTAGDGSERLFVVEKAGTIRIVRDGQLLEAPFLDITGRVGSAGSEQGLLGLAFHPDYATTGLFFVNYTDRNGNTVIGRYQVADDPDLAGATGETVVLTIAQPAANHNGGMLAFGPDGYLYIGMGDGGGRPENGQKPDTLLGKMLRLDVTPRAGGQPYTIPPDNPFVADPVVPGEIWLLGLRNPWRWSFDRQTGDLWIGDVGAGSYEEITRVPAGQGGLNLGWAIVEGRHCLRDPNCETEGLTMPLVEYGRDAGCVVVGGYVYRGSDFPRLQGSYLFADYCSGRIWALSHDAAEPAVPSELLVADARVSAFGEDEQGELYLTDLAGGRLYRLVNLE